MMTNSVETLLMLDPASFPVREEWNVDDVSGQIHGFASQLVLFANALTCQDNETPDRKITQSSNSLSVSDTTEAVDPTPHSSSRPRRIARSKKKAKKSTPKLAEEGEQVQSLDTIDGEEKPFDVESVIGCFVAKMFDSSLFRGQVRSVDDKSGEYLFFIDYTDGDNEEMTTKELCGDFADLSRNQRLNKAELSKAKQDSKRMALKLEKMVLLQGDSEMKAPSEETERNKAEESDAVQTQSGGIEGFERSPAGKPTTEDSLVDDLGNGNSDPNPNNGTAAESQGEGTTTKEAAADETTNAVNGPATIVADKPMNGDPAEASSTTAEKNCKETPTEEPADESNNAEPPTADTGTASTAPDQASVEAAASKTTEPSPSASVFAMVANSPDGDTQVKPTVDEPSDIDVTSAAAIAEYATKTPAGEDESESPSKRPRLS